METDSCIMLNANHTKLIRHYFKIMIRTVDTDVAVLAVSLAATLGPEYDLWLAIGTGEHFRYLAVIELLLSLELKDPRHFQCFMPLHAVTLCPALLDMERRRHGIFGMHCHSLLMQC